MYRLGWPGEYVNITKQEALIYVVILTTQGKYYI